MKEMKIKSVYPIYLTGLVWLIYALFFDLYKASDLIIAAIISIVVYFVFSRLLPDKTISVPDEYVFNKTGDAERDAVLAAGRDFIQTLNKLREGITDAHMTEYIDRLRESGRKMFEFVEKNPVDARQIRGFINYYIPTAIKLLNSYEELEGVNQQAAGGAIIETKRKIEGVMESVVTAFDKQLGVLYEDKALDIKTDIEVLKNILRAEGLADDGDSIREGGETK